MTIPSNILQSLISINRQGIYELHSYIDILKDLKDNYPEESEKYQKEITKEQDRLVSVVRNQLAMKKALREKYEADKWDVLTFVYEEA